MSTGATCLTTSRASCRRASPRRWCTIHGAEPDLAERIKAAIPEWTLVVIAYDAERAASTDTRFLWTTFTRFEPAADLYATSTRVHLQHLVYGGSILIDARMKAPYPDKLSCDPDTATTVARRWRENFPGGGDMGNAEAGHLDKV